MILRVTVSQPTAQAKIGWQFYLIFIIPTFFLGLLQLYVLPEVRSNILLVLAQAFLMSSPGPDKERAIGRGRSFVRKQ